MMMNIVQKATNRTAMASLMYLPQNGVVDQGYFGSGGSTPEASAIDSRNGINPTIPPKLRPTALSVSPKSDYVKTATKTLREDSSDVDDGSLPCTPEIQSDSEPDVSVCPAEEEALEIETKRLIKPFLRDFAGLSKSRWSESKALSTMRRVVDDVLEKHRYAYNGRFQFLYGY